jgi:TRAP-type C4-dicarboxylate transport system permease large subunit
MDILKREYLGLLLLVIVILILFIGTFKAIFCGIIIVLIKYLVDKFLSEKINPVLDKIVAWLKSKF